MAHNRSEKEETLELHIPLCPPDNCKITPPQICPGSGSDPDRFDPGVSGSERLPEKKDLVADTRKRGSVCGGGGEEEREGEKKAVNRCWGCKKRVGLTGFRCRCGELFCAVHRYSDRHDCSFDYKTAAREAIARENPVVRAAKILKV